MIISLNCVKKQKNMLTVEKFEYKMYVSSHLHY